jgi:signal transduction histidine kinase
LLTDAAVGVLAAAFAVAVVAADSGGLEWSNWPALALAAVGGGVLAVRRRNPVAVVVVVTVARVALVALGIDEIALSPAAVIALYTVARSGDRRVRLPVAVLAAVVMMVAVAALGDDDFWPELAGEGAQMLLPIAVAEALRNRQERVQSLIETEAAARVQAERLRIARDLHDVVAHGLSTIAVQSGVAARLVDQDPALAKEALENINHTGKRSLDELRAMVGVLRSADGTPLQPTPADPDDLSGLLATARDSGLQVSTTVTGSFPPDTADAVVVAVHRIIQEALTNVRRHAGAVAVDLVVCHADDAASLRVTNGPGTVDGNITPSTGVGVVGMTERAEALGGTLRAGTTENGGFEVVATVPYYGRSR